jgi:hypothetical protein
VEMWWSAIFIGRADQALCHPVVEWESSCVHNPVTGGSTKKNGQ